MSVFLCASVVTITLTEVPERQTPDLVSNSGPEMAFVITSVCLYLTSTNLVERVGCLTEHSIMELRGLTQMHTRRLSPALLSLCLPHPTPINTARNQVASKNLEPRTFPLYLTLYPTA